MAYGERIKNFSHIREYMRAFYVYGFQSREDFSRKSARSYDNERRRVESYLGDFMSFRRTPGGKTVFLSIDSRYIAENPLYNAWKAKSFTDGDITLHFLLFDILYDAAQSFSLQEIIDALDARLAFFSQPKTFDESTVRKKLKEYCGLGLVQKKGSGREIRYCRSADTALQGWEDAVAFFSQAGVLGVIGSFISDKTENKPAYFQQKHHYITDALDSEILCCLFHAITDKREIVLSLADRKNAGVKQISVVPMKIFISAQNGRVYLLAGKRNSRLFASYRVDFIDDVVEEDTFAHYDSMRQEFENMQRNMWGVRCYAGKTLEHVRFTVRVNEEEAYIVKRLKREKRCGCVKQLDARTWEFTADVYDAMETVPWLRTFIGRIAEMDISNPMVARLFAEDLKAMYDLYGLEEDKP